MKHDWNPPKPQPNRGKALIKPMVSRQISPRASAVTLSLDASSVKRDIKALSGSNTNPRSTTTAKVAAGNNFRHHGSCLSESLFDFRKERASAPAMNKPAR